jgi:SAM-dependent methyltransferase
MTALPSHLRATAAAYDRFATRYADLARDSFDRLPLDRAFVTAFAACVRDASAARPVVADLGCGPGHLTALLRDLGLDASGVDLSPAMVALARRDHPGLRFTTGSTDALDLADGALDGAVSWYALIHLPPHEVPAHLAEFRRVIAPGGHLALAFFDAEDGPVAVFDHKVTPARRWPVDTLAALAADASFTEVGRMMRAPLPGERFRRGHLLLRRSGPVGGPQE